MLLQNTKTILEIFIRTPKNLLVLVLTLLSSILTLAEFPLLPAINILVKKII